jgi:hypothetical protein
MTRSIKKLSIMLLSITTPSIMTLIIRMQYAAIYVTIINVMLSVALLSYIILGVFRMRVMILIIVL